jgi:NADPH2:quinone reductase
VPALSFQQDAKKQDMNTTEETNVIRINRQGPPSVLEYATASVRQPQGSEVVIEQKAIAVNFVDVLFRNGSFPLNQFPATIGVEAAGVVTAVGEGVQHFRPGDRVAYYFSLGAYAGSRVINENELVKLPEDISFDTAASLMAKGLTARMLVRQAYPVKKGDVVLVHAAAGGVGSLVSRWAKALGATVVAAVGTASKKSLVLDSGFEHVVALDTEDLISRINDITGEQGVDAVLDGVGKATFSTSVEILKNGGTYVLFGTASGEPQIDRDHLASRQIKLSRPSVGQYLPDRQAVDAATGELFQALRTGILGDIKTSIYSLKDAAAAHQDLESGKTTGSIILHP